MMRCVLTILVLTGTSLLLGTPARGASEIVIAIRYLQPEGTSHSHLYLFREDGKLVRQLTNDSSDKTPLQFLRLMAATLSSHAKNPITIANFGALIHSAKR